VIEPNVSQFDADVRANQGYLYTTNAKKSSVLANRRLTDITRAMVELGGRRVIDVGCGDGTYSAELFAACAPAAMVGVDASGEAIENANRTLARPGLRFDTCSVYDLPYEAGSFDVAVVRGLLHHLDDAPRALARIGALAPHVFVIEPNGYNPTLKMIERFSRYHREHGEKSYAPALLRRWIRELGGTIEREHYAGLVPFFCPDWMATALKAIEPMIEAMPAARQLSCAVFTVRYRTRG
jgi:2-polyprenyl-3-methyl-5-hydroxy-6-metoxy-1,4-benzoquinol methylase